MGENIVESVSKNSGIGGAVVSEKEELERCLESMKSELADQKEHMSRMQAELQSQFSQINELKKLVEIKESLLGESQTKEANVSAELDVKRGELSTLNERLQQYETAVRDMRQRLDEKLALELSLKSDNDRLETRIGKKSSSSSYFFEK